MAAPDKNSALLEKLAAKSEKGFLWVKDYLEAKASNPNLDLQEHLKGRGVKYGDYITEIGKAGAPIDVMAAFRAAPKTVDEIAAKLQPKAVVAEPVVAAQNEVGLPVAKTAAEQKLARLAEKEPRIFEALVEYTKPPAGKDLQKILELKGVPYNEYLTKVGAAVGSSGDAISLLRTNSKFVDGAMPFVKDSVLKMGAVPPIATTAEQKLIAEIAKKDPTIIPLVQGYAEANKVGKTTEFLAQHGLTNTTYLETVRKVTGKPSADIIGAIGRVGGEFVHAVHGFAAKLPWAGKVLAAASLMTAFSEAANAKTPEDRTAALQNVVGTAAEIIDPTGIVGWHRNGGGKMSADEIARVRTAPIINGLKNEAGRVEKHLFDPANPAQLGNVSYQGRPVTVDDIRDPVKRDEIIKVLEKTRDNAATPDTKEAYRQMVSELKNYDYTMDKVKELDPDGMIQQMGLDIGGRNARRQQAAVSSNAP